MDKINKNNKNKSRVVIIALLSGIFTFPAFIFTACSDIIEVNLTEKEVLLNTPPDDYTTTKNGVNFWWNPLDGAVDYELQIVSPDYENLEELILDTITAKNTFTTTLEPGKYEWTITALNSSSSAYSTIRKLNIVETIDLNNQTVELLNPVDNDTSNITDLRFNWKAVNQARNYDFELKFDNELVHSENMEELFIEYKLENGDGTYTWGVKASNEETSTSMFYHSYLLDTEVPGEPTLSEPENNSILEDKTHTFSWERAPNTGSDLYDSIFVFSDEELSQMVLSKKRSQSSYQDSLGPGEYYWLVKTCDVAGNESVDSQVWQFTINE